MLWHWGDNGVFKDLVMADPARKSGVVMFANGQDALNVAKPIHRHSNGHKFPGIRVEPGRECANSSMTDKIAKSPTDNKPLVRKVVSLESTT
jgi:hypothetical protein